MKLAEFSRQFNIFPNVKQLGVDAWLIYFLIDGDQIVYVGKSSEGGLFGRLRSHQVDKQFTEYFTVNGIATESAALSLEKGFISIIRPKYNKAEAKVNIEAIRRVINYIANTGRGVLYEAANATLFAHQMERAKSKARSYRSRMARNEGDETTNRAGLAKALDEITRLEKILSSVK